MAKLTKQVSEAVLSLALLMLFSASALAQDQPPPSVAGQISPTLRSAAYPEAIYPGGIMPDWDRGYVIHYESEMNHSPDTPMVVMYDATGKRIREGRIWPQGAGSVRIRRTAATQEGSILAAGWAIMEDGSTQHYIVKTDLTGNTIQSLLTGGFGTEQFCEAPDGTVWSLGKTVSSEDGLQDDTTVLRHYSFEKGLVHSFLPEETVQAVVRSNRPWFSPSGSLLQCGKDKVAAYLDFTDEYVEVSTSSFELKRWKLDEAVVQHGKASGLAVTDDGRVYASFSAQGRSGPVGLTGLYQVMARAGNPLAQLLPVAGTTSVFGGKYERAPGTLLWLWGADGNKLVVRRFEEWDMSWVNVTHSESTD